MKKVGVLLLFILLFSLVLVVADTNSTNNTTSSTNTSVNTSITVQINQSVQDKAYACLEQKVYQKCAGLSVSEISFILLSNPSQNTTSECKSALLDKKDPASCWPKGGCTIKDTALAVMALNNYGEDTSAAENWLISKNRTATDLIWFLEQDAANSTQCKITYSSNDYTINVADNKKIDADAGTCLTRAQSNFWLQVDPSCYDNEYAISCNQQFVSTLLYKFADSSTIYVSSDTKSSPALGIVTLKINARCFGLSSCDYEGSLWATRALLKTGHSIENYLPYIIAGGENNQAQLPDAFIYQVSGYEDYGTRLIQEQRPGNHWEADNTAHGRFYDTALALLALSSSASSQVNNAKLWLGFVQDQSGCWKTGNDVRDTAIILWAITNRLPTGGVIAPTTRCSQGGFFCIPTIECPSDQKLGNYYCDGLLSCCRTQNLKTCSEYSGQFCNSTTVCMGNERESSDSTSASPCCTGTCEVPSTPTETECGKAGLVCRASCASNQQEVSKSCTGTDICCESKPASGGSSWWIWLLIIGILVILAILIYMYREKLKLWWFSRKHGVKSEPASAPPFGPRPGFPPIRRGPPMPMPVRQQMAPQRAPVKPAAQPQKPVKKEDDTFKKLREMSK